MLLLLGLLACSSPEPEHAGPQLIRLGYIPIADCAQLYVADALDLWAAHGLRVEETSMPGGARLLEALAAGSLDVAFSNAVSLLQARERGLPFASAGGAVVETAGHDPHRLLLRRELGFRGPASLAGRRVGVNTLRNIDWMVLSEYLRSGGLALDAVSLREIPFPRMEGVLASGELDAASAIEPYVSFALSRHPELEAPVDPFLELAPRTLVATYVMREDAARGPLGAAVRAVLAEASRWIEAHPAETRERVAERTHLDPAVVATMPLSAMEPYPRAEDLLALARRARDAGLLRDLSAVEGALVE